MLTMVTWRSSSPSPFSGKNPQSIPDKSQYKLCLKTFNGVYWEARSLAWRLCMELAWSHYAIAKELGLTPPKPLDSYLIFQGVGCHTVEIPVL